MSDRDTHFAGWAASLFDALPWDKINIDMEWPGWEEHFQLVMAQYAYDLVHTSLSSASGQTKERIDEVMAFVPDPFAE